MDLVGVAAVVVAFVGIIVGLVPAVLSLRRSDESRVLGLLGEYETVTKTTLNHLYDLQSKASRGAKGIELDEATWRAQCAVAAKAESAARRSFPALSHSIGQLTRNFDSQLRVIDWSAPTEVKIERVGVWLRASLLLVRDWSEGGRARRRSKDHGRYVDEALSGVVAPFGLYSADDVTPFGSTPLYADMERARRLRKPGAPPTPGPWAANDDL